MSSPDDETEIRLSQGSLDTIIEGVAAKLQEATKSKEPSDSSRPGALGRIPSALELDKAGVQSFTSEDPTKKDRGEPVLKLPGAEKTNQQLVTVGACLPALSQKLIDKIQANEYVDFAELPPAKGKSKPLSNALEGQDVVVQAADLLQSRRVIPNFVTWCQCFAVYAAVLAQHKPERLTDLMAYQLLIAKVSLKFKWPSWVVYDQNFQQDAAGNQQLAWTKVDPGIYAQCFTNQAISSENWCNKCHALDHSSSSCPSRSRKRLWSTVTARSQGGEDEICRKFNCFNGDCKFCKDCKYRHVCLRCREAHPVSKCRGQASASGGGGSSSSPSSSAGLSRPVA